MEGRRGAPKQAPKHKASDQEAAPKRKLAVGYVRVSTEHQRDGISLEQIQQTAINRFCDRAGYTLIDTIPEVATAATDKSTRTRPRLKQALDLAAREGAVLVVWDWSRLSRHRAIEREVVKSIGLDRVVSVKEGETFRQACEHGRIESARAERDEISRRTKQGMARRIAEGVRMGNANILDVQRQGVAAWSSRSEGMVRKIADLILELRLDLEEVTRGTMVSILNMRGITTLHGKVWTIDRMTMPLRRAKSLLRSEEAEANYQDNPNFGVF